MKDPVVNRAWPGVVGLFGLVLMVTAVGAASWSPLACLLFASFYTLAMYRWARARIRSRGEGSNTAPRFRSRDERSDVASRLIRLAFATTWTVEAGDTLATIASVWRVSVASVATLNNIVSPADIRIGQVLLRPFTITVLTPAEETSRPEVPSDGLAVGEQWRDPLWSITVSELGDQRQALADRIVVDQKRVAALAAALRDTDSPEVWQAPTARAELDSLRAELVDLRTQMLAAGRSGARSMVEWVAVPRAEVVELPRSVSACCDCRYGHYDYHAIVGHENGRVTRECGWCEPPTRWIEIGASR